MPDISILMNRTEQCHKEVALEYYNAFAGVKDTLDVVPLMAKYPDLYSRETLDFVCGLDVAAAGDERSLRFMKEVFTGNYFHDEIKHVSEQLVNAEGDATVKCDEDEFPYRAAPIVLANENDYDKRGRLDDAYVAKLAEMNPLRREIDEKARALVKDLGYRDMIDLCERLNGMRIYPLRDQLTAFLDETEEIYRGKLEEHSGKLMGVGSDKLRHADIGYLMRAQRYDDLFPPDKMVPALQKTLAGLGIDLDSQDNITLDLEVREKKSPRAFCIGIDTPRDVRLVLMPRGGQDDYSTLFHEAGHLQFGAHMSPEISFLYRNHGDTSVHESYAFLLQHLVDDRVWWREIMGADPGEYPAFAKFHRLYFLRRYSAKLHYEVEYYEKDAALEMASRYAEWLERGCCIPYPHERYLADFDGGFYVLQYLQAWIWEVQLRAHLKREFGEAWFMNRAAGDFLRDLWKDGMKYDVWEIAEKLGYDGLDIAPLQKELTG